MTAKAETADLFVIGGGINGCGIARDAAGRGLSVVLAEKGDLAQATSSASTKLFHGGLRYLEYFEFRLVREALVERETLLAAMPHISWPMRFVLPYSPDMRFESDTPTARLLGSGDAGDARPPAGLADPARAVPLRHPRRAEAPAADAHARPRHRPGRPAAQAASSGGPSSIPTAGSRTRAWSRSTRATPPRGARASSSRTRVVAARARRRALAGDDRGRARARRAPGARARQRRRPLGRRGAPRHRPRRHPGRRAAGAGQPHRHAAALRPRPLLLLPGDATGGSSSPSPTSRTSP